MYEGATSRGLRPQQSTAGLPLEEGSVWQGEVCRDCGRDPAIDHQAGAHRPTNGAALYFNMVRRGLHPVLWTLPLLSLLLLPLPSSPLPSPSPPPPPLLPLPSSPSLPPSTHAHTIHAHTWVHTRNQLPHSTIDRYETLSLYTLLLGS